jgi:hypothetical protein
MQSGKSFVGGKNKMKKGTDLTKWFLGNLITAGIIRKRW